MTTRNDRRLEAKAQARGNARLRLAVREVYTRTDREIEATKPAAVTCTKGCTACCKQLVVLTLPEAIAIAEEHPEAVRRALPRLVAQDMLLDKLSEHIPPEQYMTPETRHELCDGWWEAGQSCAFLGADDSCQVYRTRPLACRSYHVVTPPAQCGGERGQEVHIWNPASLMDAHQKLFEISAACTGGDVVMAPLPSAMMFAWKRRSP